MWNPCEDDPSFQCEDMNLEVDSLIVMDEVLESDCGMVPGSFACHFSQWMWLFFYG